MSELEKATGASQPEGNSGGGEWSDDETRTLIDNWKQDVSFARIASMIGRTRRSVAVKACRLGLTQRANEYESYFETARRNGQARRCMSCKRIFFSEGPGNRICRQCKNRASWKSGGDFALQGH